MVRVRKKCSSLNGQKADARHRSEVASSVSQTRREPKRMKDFQGKLSHSSPPVTRSCSLTHVTEKKNQDMKKVTNGNASASCSLNNTKQEFDPQCDNDIEIIAVISWHNKTKSVQNPLQCATLQSNSQSVSKKTDFLKPQVVLPQGAAPVSCINEMFTLETQPKSELHSEYEVPNIKKDQMFGENYFFEEETEPLMILPDGLDKVELEVEVETSIDLCAPTSPIDNSHDQLISQTPHRIQICNDDILTQSPSSALSSLNLLSISQTPKKAVKSSRKLHPSQTSNQQVAFRSPRPKQSDIIKQVIATNHKIDEYYPIVRRSNRKTKKTIFEEQQLEIEQAIKEEREDGLEVHNFEGKGRGVVTTRPFSRGEFVVEYSGELIDLGEAKLRETVYTQDQNSGCYMYYFKYRNRQYCIDATSESGRLGRLVNHSRINSNLITKTVLVENKPHLVLLAKDDIPAGEEIMYDYGDRSKESLRHHPWLKC